MIKNVKKIVDVNNENSVSAPEICSGIVEYKMSKELAEHILNNARTKSGKLPKPAQEILCEYVNRERGLKGYCVRVIAD